MQLCAEGAEWGGVTVGKLRLLVFIVGRGRLCHLVLPINGTLGTLHASSRLTLLMMPAVNSQSYIGILRHSGMDSEALGLGIRVGLECICFPPFAVLGSLEARTSFDLRSVQYRYESCCLFLPWPWTP